MIEDILIIALLASFVIILLRKWDILDYYEAHYGHIKWLPSGSCYFCFGFWISIVIAFLTGRDPLYAMATAPIIAFLTHVIIVNERN